MLVQKLKTLTYLTFTIHLYTMSCMMEVKVWERFERLIQNLSPLFGNSIQVKVTGNLESFC